jgi:hypothetical protein
MNADHDATGQSDTGRITSDQSGSAPGNGSGGGGSASQDGNTQNSADPGGAVHGQTDQNGAAQGSAGQGGEKPSAPAAGLGRAAMITAIALIVVYIVMLFILMSMRNDKDWDRLVYLLSGFEALVFAGAGALFGTTIQRANVTAARNDAADAKKEAADAKQTAQSQSDRAQQAEKDAAAGRFLAAAVTAKADTRANGGSEQLLGPDRGLADTPRVRGSRPDTETSRPAPAAGLDADLEELSALARTILPD